MKAAFTSLVLGIVLVSAPARAIGPEARSPRVDPALAARLAASADGTTYVIVMLRPVSGTLGARGTRKAAAAAIQERVLARLAPADFAVAYRYQSFAALTGRVSASGLAKLATDAEVLAVGPDGDGHAQLDQSVPFIGADQVHALGVTGVDQTVAVLDTGIDTDHPDLADDIAAGGWHFLNQGGNQGPGAEDDNGHGTNVSGVITSKGMVSSPGVAPNADILAIKVLSSTGSGFLSDWAMGVDYVVDHKDDYTNLCAINMSLGSFTLYSQCPCDNVDAISMLLQASLQAAEDANIITFCSSGNQGSTVSMSSPACLSSGVAVAAVYDQNLGRQPGSGTYQSNFGASFGACFDGTTAPDQITCFTNRSGCNDLAAPGRLIAAPGLGGGISQYTGTSQASPHCAGLVALIADRRFHRGAVPLTPAELLALLKNTGVATNDPAATSPNPRRIDAEAALAAASPPVPAATTVGLGALAALLLGGGVFMVTRRRSGPPRGGG